MDANENGILLCVLDLDALLERNKNVGRTRHYDFQIGFAELAGKAFGDIEIATFSAPPNLR